jgi:phosphate transport system permease protein
MSVPAIAALVIFQFLFVWNDLLVALVYIGATNSANLPLTVTLANLTNSLGQGYNLLTAIVLGMMRAAGEALAVQMVIGNAAVIPTSLAKPLTTLTSQITLDMGNTVSGSPWNEVLWTMGLILLCISIAFVMLVRTLGRRRIGA